MALSISQIVAASYPAVVAESRKAANQWAESAFMSELERQGAIKRMAFGQTIEAPLNYRSNPAATFLVNDLDDTGISKTDVLTAASYNIGQISVPFTWSRGDDAKNPSENQKIALVKELLENALDSHDVLIEQALFSTTTNGFLGLQNLVADNGQGTVGGVDSGTETWFRNQTGTYLADGSDMEASMTTIYNAAAKGTGSKLSPKIVVSGSAPHALFESTLVPRQRYESQDAKASFRSLMFKDARYVWSNQGGTRIYFLNPTSFKLCVSKGNFRDIGPEIVLQSAEGYKRSVYSALQAITNNRTRLGVLTQV